MPLLLSETDVRALVSMPELIDAMEEALCAFSRGAVEQPVRTVVEVGDEPAFFGLMPAWLPGAPALGAKLVTVYQSNLAKGLTSHQASIVLLDPDTGALLALMDGRYITEKRTAAVSAVSVRKLARRDARTLAIFGSGVQARSHLEALTTVHRFDEVRAWSNDAAGLARYAAETGARAMESGEAAARGADVIVTVTASQTAVLNNAWVSDGAHIVAVGACRPAHRELEGALVARARLFVDSRAAALKEAGDIVLPIKEGSITADHIRGELGEAVARQSDSEVTLFKSLGLAVEDIAAAHLVLRRAQERGIGHSFSLS